MHTPQDQIALTGSDQLDIDAHMATCGRNLEESELGLLALLAHVHRDAPKLQTMPTWQAGAKPPHRFGLNFQEPLSNPEPQQSSL